jgi:hypothetical protein
MRPSLIVGCDWSVWSGKRWSAAARRVDDAVYEVAAPTAVHQTSSFFSDLVKSEPTGPILTGFDFPIGVPRLYAATAEITQFTATLPHLGQGQWADFYRLAEKADEISIMRPFYPFRPGGTKRQHLVEGLGVRSPGDLLRACDHCTPTRSKACSLFWTLGAKQVGRAAIAGWRDVLVPALHQRLIAIWPFDGELPEILETGRIVVAEIYPAETYSHIGLPRNFGKASRAGRKNQAAAIRTWCGRNKVALSKEVANQIDDGFGDAGTGEDQFDSVIGALGMIESVNDPSPFAVPRDRAVRNIEGWILGMRASPGVAADEGTPATVAGRQPRYSSRPVPETADDPPMDDVHARWCPACGRHPFVRWPLDWDGHAAYVCSGIEGDTPAERRRAYRERYLS